MRSRGANFLSSTCPARTASSSSSSRAKSGTFFSTSGLHAIGHLFGKIPLLHISSGLSKSRILDWNINLNVRNLNREATVRPRQRPTERHFPPFHFAIVCVVDLRWIPPERSLAITHQPLQQS